MRWLPVAVLELRRDDIISTQRGAGRVRDWTWLLERGQVRVTVTLIDRTRHVEVFTDDDFALRRSPR